MSILKWKKRPFQWCYTVAMMVMMMSWLWIMQCIIWGGDKRVRVTAPVKATAKNEVSTHSGVQTFTTWSKKKTSKQVGSCAIFYRRRIFLGYLDHSLLQLDLLWGKFRHIRLYLGCSLLILYYWGENSLKLQKVVDVSLICLQMHFSRFSHTEAKQQSGLNELRRDYFMNVGRF